ncbi:MAG: hypothetical protein SGPRY_006132, partial [Prymnesium sp.]
VEHNALGAQIESASSVLSAAALCDVATLLTEEVDSGQLAACEAFAVCAGGGRRGLAAVQRTAFKAAASALINEEAHELLISLETVGMSASQTIYKLGICRRAPPVTSSVVDLLQLLSELVGIFTDTLTYGKLAAERKEDVCALFFAAIDKAAAKYLEEIRVEGDRGAAALPVHTRAEWNCAEGRGECGGRKGSWDAVWRNEKLAVPREGKLRFGSFEKAGSLVGGDQVVVVLKEGWLEKMGDHGSAKGEPASKSMLHDWAEKIAFYNKETTQRASSVKFTEHSASGFVHSSAAESAALVLQACIRARKSRLPFARSQDQALQAKFELPLEEALHQAAAGCRESAYSLIKSIISRSMYSLMLPQLAALQQGSLPPLLIRCNELAKVCISDALPPWRLLLLHGLLGTLEFVIAYVHTAANSFATVVSVSPVHMLKSRLMAPTSHPPTHTEEGDEVSECFRCALQNLKQTHRKVGLVLDPVIERTLCKDLMINVVDGLNDLRQFERWLLVNA